MPVTGNGARAGLVTLERVVLPTHVAAHVTWMRNLLDAEELTAAAHWADLHGVLDRSSALPGAERMVRFGGDGTPGVAEFAPAELGPPSGSPTTPPRPDRRRARPAAPATRCCGPGSWPAR